MEQSMTDDELINALDMQAYEHLRAGDEETAKTLHLAGRRIELLRQALQGLIDVGVYVATEPGVARERYTSAEIAAQKTLTCPTSDKENQ